MVYFYVQGYKVEMIYAIAPMTIQFARDCHSDRAEKSAGRVQYIFKKMVIAEKRNV